MNNSQRITHQVMVFIFVFSLITFDFTQDILAQGAFKRKTGANPNNPKQSIEKVLFEQVEAWNKGNLEGFMAGYWQSESLSFYSGKSITNGWQQTLDRYRLRYQSEGKEMGTLTFKDLEIEVLGTNNAFVRGKWQLELKSETVGGLFTLVLRKFPDGWRVIHDHTS